jgi:Uma2 family endonuclease
VGMSAPRYYTADMVRALPDDGNRYEVVYGELLVTPAPRLWHQVLVKRLSLALELYLERQPTGELLTSPADISWGPDVLVQPDVFVVPLDEARTLTWSRIRTLLLVAEVLSPSSARGDGNPPARGSPSRFSSQSSSAPCEPPRLHNVSFVPFVPSW